MEMPKCGLIGPCDAEAPWLWLTVKPGLEDIHLCESHKDSFAVSAPNLIPPGVVVIDEERDAV